LPANFSKSRILSSKNFNNYVFHIDFCKQKFYDDIKIIKNRKMEMIEMKEINKSNKSFEDIKHIDKNNVEFWYARELMPVLQYSN